MNFQDDAPIVQKTYDLYKGFYELIDHFPKKSREVLINKIEVLILELLELLSSAEFSPASTKIQSLSQASIKLDFLKLLFRMTYEFKIINQPKYLELEKHLQEIGKMLGGWIKSLRG
ncbi:MAG: diversity-generating retroelement protein Avd [Patescibacteria group bacterium]